MMLACGRLCCSIELGWAGPGDSGDCACRHTTPLSRFVPRAGVVQLRGSVCLPTHPPTGGAGFVCLSGLVFPRPGGGCRSLSLRALVSATLWTAPSPLAMSVSGTPSLSYMICRVLVQCVPTPLANHKKWGIAGGLGALGIAS